MAKSLPQLSRSHFLVLLLNLSLGRGLVPLVSNAAVLEPIVGMNPPPSRLAWTEFTVKIVESVLSSRPALDLASEPEATSLFISAAEDSAASLSKSLKFSQLLFAFVSKHPKAASPHKAALLQLCETLDTFLKKSIRNKLSKM